MLPEKGGASYFTLLVADRLQDLGRPVTIDELVADVAQASGLPWSWITQRHQAHIASSRVDRVLPIEVGSTRSEFDPVLGWHVDGYNPSDPATMRAGLRYCIAKLLSNGKRVDKHNPWVIQDPDGRFRRNPDAHPRVVSNGKNHLWDPTTRAASEAEGSAAVKVINEASIDRRVNQLNLEQRATILRHLVAKLPADRRAWTTGQVRSILRDIDDVHVDAEPQAILELIHRYAGDA